MVLVALLETGHVVGNATIKADIHTKAVLGRLFDGREYTDDEALAAASRIDSQQPHTLDRGLFEIGRKYCLPLSPNCTMCPLAAHCTFHQKQSN
jgi:adenine-specific DNA glycosylase